MDDIKASAEQANVIKGVSLKSELSKIGCPAFNMPDVKRYQLPACSEPSAEKSNEYQSASAFMQAIAEAALEWKESLPEGYVPAVLAVMYGGIQIKVESLAQVSFDGIRIQGTLDGSPCTMLAHQSTVQVLCYGKVIEQLEEKNPIGFVWPDNNVQV